MQEYDTLFDFDDILIIPSKFSQINSRSEVNIQVNHANLPLMTAPMDTVINEKNYKIFMDYGIKPVLPRVPNPDLDYYNTDYFLSYSLDDFYKIFIENTPIIPEDKKIYVLIDVANGHMKKLLDLANEAKFKYKHRLFLMIGNIANPESFNEYARINVDAIRLGIGNGNGCLTTVQTGIGYPMASLIHECNLIKLDNNYHKTLIVADGGFKKYSDIIKALALGANYVMLGSIFNKALESAGETTKVADTLGNHEIIDQYSEEAKQMFNAGIPLYKTFRGMSTKEVQKSWGKENLTTSEGVVRRNNVEYTLEGWVNNFESYLRSAMSYTNKKSIYDFIGNVMFRKITMNSFKRFDK